MKLFSPALISLVTLGTATAGLLSCVSARAQTYIWADNAQGQVYQTCPVIGNEFWPANTLWSQSAHLSDNCDSSGYVYSQPSNWSPWPAADVYPGGPGAANVNVVLGPPANTILDVDATVNNFTLQPNGALTVNHRLTANHFDLQGDGSMTGVGGAGSTGFGGSLVIASGGSFTKSGGSGSFSFGSGGAGVTLSGDNCSVVVQSGNLSLPFGGGNGGVLYNATLALSNNTSLFLEAPDNLSYEHGFIGTLTGTGEGKVLWNRGQFWCQGFDLSNAYHSGLILNFPTNMLQWAGGAFSSGGPVTNIGFISITNTAAGLYGVTLYNQGFMSFAPGTFWTLTGSSAVFNNQSAGSASFLGDVSITGGGHISNYGLLRKTGAGAASIYPEFKQYNGMVEVDAGSLALNLSYGGYFTNATLIVSNGAALNLLVSNYTLQVQGTLRGFGGGTVLMSSGTLAAPSGVATLNFPGSMFQWQGGTLGGAGNTENADTINLSGPGTISGWLTNNGTMIQSGSGGIPSGGHLQNRVGAIYELRNDNDITLSDFYNYGLLEKTAGAGTNRLNASFYNYGTILAGSGGLNFSGNLFQQNGGNIELTPAFTFGPNQTVLNAGSVAGIGTFGGSNAGNATTTMNGGVLSPGNPYGVINVPDNLQIYAGTLNFRLGGPSQFSQLAAGKSAYIMGGTVNVSIDPSYAPAIGTQFHILSCPTRAGSGFSTINVPRGISATYSNTGVFLTVTSAVPTQMTDPRLSGTNLLFKFATLANHSYTVLANTNLATANWTFYTNLTGNGELLELAVPAQEPPQRFFRLREP